MKKTLKRATLQLLKSTGVIGLVRDRAWRRRRLLILCYHSISHEDEHLWRPGLHLEPSRLEQRYRSGVHSREFLPWLAEENIISATTCVVGLASAHTNPLLLPRMVETNGRTALEFEGWLTGVADLLAVHRGATQRYIPRGDQPLLRSSVAGRLRPGRAGWAACWM
jgi:hypothetical protein